MYIHMHMYVILTDERYCWGSHIVSPLNPTCIHIHVCINMYICMPQRQACATAHALTSSTH